MDCKITENFLHELTRSGATLARTMNKEEIDSKIRQIQEWSDANPGPTYLSDFLEKYPFARLSEDGIPDTFCPNTLGYFKGNCPEIQCIACWNTAMEDKPCTS